MSWLRVAVLFVATGCGHIYRKHDVVWKMMAVSSDHELVCYKLDNKQFGWGAIAIGSAALSGGASSVMAGVDNRNAQYGLIAGAVFFTAFGAVSTYLQNHYVKAYTAQCTK